MVLAGNVEINIPHGKKVEHLGVKIEMVGQIELYFDKGSNMKFTTLVRELESAGSMTASKVSIYIYICLFV